MRTERTIFHELLALDCIYHVLLFSDRIFLHRCISNKTEPNEEGSENLSLLYEALKKHRWKSPEMKYPEFHPDQLYYRDKDYELISIENYARNHPEITKSIETTFKNL